MKATLRAVTAASSHVRRCTLCLYAMGSVTKAEKQKWVSKAPLHAAFTPSCAVYGQDHNCFVLAQVLAFLRAGRVLFGLENGSALTVVQYPKPTGTTYGRT
jgi:hypothetical protein